ncbi:hypothetical protein ACMHYB_14510 [Sorangium sp. So ce1128]
MKIVRILAAAVAALGLGSIAIPASASHVSPASLGTYIDVGDEDCFP